MTGVSAVMPELEAKVAVAQAISAVPDPEIPVISIADLGILRGVEVDESSRSVLVTITPTYSGCPAMEAIRSRIEFEASRAGRRRWSGHRATGPARRGLPPVRIGRHDRDHPLRLDGLQGAATLQCLR